jgi:penicillin-binding protein 2
MERITRFRALAMLLAFALILGLFGGRMYAVQMLDAGHVVADSDTYTTYYTVKAARGEILDRNGNVMVGNRATYNLVFNTFVLTNTKGANDHLLRLVKMARELGVDYIENFPVTETRPYEYTLSEQSAAWQGYFQDYLWYLEIDSDISASRLMEELRKLYKIPEGWSDADARAVIGLYYELMLRTDITNLSSYVFLEDVPDDILNAILELNVPGLDAAASTTREYYTTYAAHILGTISAMNSDDWKVYKEKGYKMDDKIGKTGLEKAFEEYLHGTDGRLARVVDKNGNIVSQYYTKEPVAGHNVETSIDLNLQIVAEETMRQIHETLTTTNGTDGGGNGADIQGMACVVMDTRTGEVLACASYPSYDPATFNKLYNELMEDPLKPTRNRALMEAYPPGSTFKVAMSIAGLESGKIDRYTQIRDDGVFTKYPGSSPKCLFYSRTGGTHGYLDVAGALRVSCNYFYYKLGDWMDWEDVDSVVKSLGLGEHTGIELGENIGQRANAETKKKNYSGSDANWYAMDQVLASIGQSDHRYTPMQLCAYASAVANKGTRYAATFLKRVVSADYSELVEENTREILSVTKMSPETIAAVYDGMHQVTSASGGSGVSAFRGFDIKVCGKTGTAEHETGGSSNGAFICFAPMDTPEIAVSVYGEKAGSGSYMARVARAVLEAYFGADETSDAETYENKVG